MTSTVFWTCRVLRLVKLGDSRLAVWKSNRVTVDVPISGAFPYGFLRGLHQRVERLMMMILLHETEPCKWTGVIFAWGSRAPIPLHRDFFTGARFSSLYLSWFRIWFTEFAQRDGSCRTMLNVFFPFIMCVYLFWHFIWQKDVSAIFLKCSATTFCTILHCRSFVRWEVCFCKSVFSLFNEFWEYLPTRHLHASVTP